MTAPSPSSNGRSNDRNRPFIVIDGTKFPQNAREAARIYLQAGLAVVPVESKTKGGAGMPKGWPDLWITEAQVDQYFQPDSNIGLILGAGSLFDLDLDCPEASAAAGVLMPTRSNSCGRQSKQRSHIFFRYDFDDRAESLTLSDPVREAELNDPGRRKELRDASVDLEHYAIILEIRTGRAMTVVPPSTHPSGERLCWGEFRESVSHVGGKQLHGLAKRLGAAALVGRYWSGLARHDTCLALAGGLLRSRWDASLVEKFVRAVCVAAGDEEVEDRVRCVTDTAEKLKAGKEVSGWPSLAKQIGTNGDYIVSRVRQWLEIDPGGGTTSGMSSAGARPTGTSATTRRDRPRYVPLPTWKPFPVECLPAPWAEYARQGAASLSPLCEPAYLALPIIAVLAGAIGNTRRVRVKPDWYEPAVWWSCIIGESGTIKSPAEELSVNLVNDRQKRLMAEYRAAYKAYKRELAAWKAENKGKGEDAEGRPEKPQPKRVLVSDITIEKLALLLDENPRGLLAYRDELAGWIGSFQRYKGKTAGSDEPNWLSIHGAKAIINDRKTGDRPSIYVPHAAVSVTGTIQPKTLARLFGQDLFDSGLVARVTMAFPTRVPKQWSDVSIDPDVKAAAEKSLDKLYGLCAEPDDDGDPRPLVVELSREARDRFKRFVNEWGQRQFQADDELAAALAKLEGMAARFALIHHVTQAEPFEDTDPIGLASIEAGIRVVEWMAAETERVYLMLAESDEERATRRLVDLVRRVADRNDCRVTVKQLQNANSRKYRRKEDAEADLASLVSLGLGRWEEGPAPPAGGHRVRAFALCTTHDDSDSRPAEDDTPGEVPEQGPHDGPPEDHKGAGGGKDGCPKASGESIPSCDNLHEPPAGRWSEGSCVVQEGVAAPAPRAPSAVSGRGPEPTVVQLDAGYRYVTSADGLDGVLTRIEESALVGLDLETTGLNSRTDRVRLLSLSLETIDGGRLSYLLDLFRLELAGLAPLWAAMAEKEVVGFNLLFDLTFLDRLGFTPGKVWDAMLASQVLDAGDRTARHSLKDMAARHLAAAVSKEEQASDWSAPILTQEQLRYAALDAELPVRLKDILVPKLDGAKLMPVAELEMRTLPAVVWAATAGVAVDRAFWLSVAAEADAEAARLQDTLDTASPGACDLFGGRNWNSPEQVKAAFAAVGVTLVTTGDDALSAVGHPLAGLVRDYRGAAKRASTYGRAWLKHVAQDGRVYPGWKQIGAGASGRMSCSEPNLQNLPRDPRYRRCYMAPTGRVLVKADYSQIELRLAAKIANESQMLDAYRRGEDLHTLTARSILGKQDVTKADRQLAKAVNFGLLYGMGAEGFRVYARSNYGVSLNASRSASHRRPTDRASGRAASRSRHRQSKSHARRNSGA